MHEYNLSSEEGVVLMCLAEALLRIPDDETMDLLIRDKLNSGRWKEHLGRSSSLFVNASTWGLMLTGRIVKPPSNLDAMTGLLQSLMRKSGEPLIRNAIRNGMRIIAHQFVLGRSIDEAISRSGSLYSPDYSYSFDMLGEAAVTRQDADVYFTAYLDAVHRLKQLKHEAGKDIFSADSLSVKLSALHPRFEFSQQLKLEKELHPRFLELAFAAKQAGIGLTLDAEEADSLNITLDLFEMAHRQPGLQDWEGLGVVVQAYQKRALPLIDWLKDLSIRYHKRIPLRLVKGAYWDSEIKHAQGSGWRDYPVFTRIRKRHHGPGNIKLSTPAIVQLRGPAIPGTVPLHVELTLRQDSAVSHGFAKIEADEISVQPLSGGIDAHDNTVTGQPGIPGCHARHQRTLGLEIHDSDIDTTLCIEHADVGFIRRIGKRIRINDLHAINYREVFPDILVQIAIQLKVVVRLGNSRHARQEFLSLRKFAA